MPILDGYDAARKIIDHYNDDGKILASRENSPPSPNEKS